MFKTSAVVAFAAVVFTTSSAVAQVQTTTDHQPHWQFIVNSGTLVPTGAQRDAIKRGGLTAAQLSYVIHPSFAVTASVGWARTRDIVAPDDPKLDAFTYDVGGEVRANHWIAGKTFSLSPFAGAGVGGRSYNYRSRDLDAAHNIAGYASGGAEVGVGRGVRVRLEARDYVTGFKPLANDGPSDTRNDLSFMVGLRLKAR